MKLQGYRITVFFPFDVVLLENKMYYFPVRKIPFAIGIILLAVFFFSSVFFGGGDAQEQLCGKIGFSIEVHIIFFALAFSVTALSFFVAYGLKGREAEVFPSFSGLFRSGRRVWLMGVFGYCMVAVLAGLVIHALLLSDGGSVTEWLHIADIASFVLGWACACLLCAFVQRKRWRALLKQKD